MITIELTHAQLSLTLKLLHIGSEEVMRDHDWVDLEPNANNWFSAALKKRVDAEYDVLRTKYLNARSRP